MSRTALRWGLRVLGLVIVGLVLWTQVDWVRLPSLLARLGGGVKEVLLALLLLAAMIVLTAWRWRVLVRALDLPLGVLQAVRLTFVGCFFNIAVPGSTGGDVVKAWAAAKETGSGVRAVVSVFADRVIGLFGLAVFAAAALWFGPAREGTEDARTLVGVVLAGGILVGVLFLSRRIRRALGLSSLLRRLPFQKVLAEADAGLRLYRQRPGAIALALLVSLVNHTGTSVACWLLARALVLPQVDLAAAIALLPVVNLVSAVPLLPGGWGVGEAAFAFFFTRIGLPATEAVTLSVIYRLSNLVVSLPGGVLWTARRGHPTAREMQDEVDRDVAEVARGVPALGEEGP